MSRKVRTILLTVTLIAIVFFCFRNEFLREKELGRESEEPDNEPSYTWEQGESVLQNQDNVGNEEFVWNLILVNAQHPLSPEFDMKLKNLRNGHAVDERIYSDLQEMLDHARAIGLNPIICSSYRSYQRQETLYKNQVSEYLAQGYARGQAAELASQWVAYPGTSEHQTGLAVDIVAGSYQLLDKNQEETAEQRWLMENSWKYGFILRYPNDKSELTGIQYEPWHYRYVGKAVAKEMYELNLCLEEYLDGSDIPNLD